MYTFIRSEFHYIDNALMNLHRFEGDENELKKVKKVRTQSGIVECELYILLCLLLGVE